MRARGNNCSSKATEPKVFGEATVWHRVVRAIRAHCVHRAEMISELAIGNCHDQRAVGIKLAPSMTFERLVCHQDVVFVICVTPQDVHDPNSVAC